MRQRGFGMVEVLITLVIVAVGLLGLAGLHIRAQRAELESYQRVQALILLDDMAGRLRANYDAARCYEITPSDPTTEFIGADNDPGTCSGWGTAVTRDRADDDLAEWDDLLEGAAETRGGTNVGAMTGARGCISYDGTGTNDRYTITIVWQGETPTKEPTSTCAKGNYGDPKLRRAVSQTVTLPTLP